MSFRFLGMNDFHAKAENERFTAAGSRCRQNLKYENSLRSLADYVKTCTKKRAARAARLFFLIQPIILLICGVVVAVAVVASLIASYLQFTALFWQLPHLSQTLSGGFRWWQAGPPVIFFYFYRSAGVAEKMPFFIKTKKVVFLTA